MHYRFTRTAVPTNFVESRDFAGRIANYLNDNHGMGVQWGLTAFSNNRIVWTTTYDSIAEWEERQMKLMADETYQGMIAEASSLYTDVDDELVVIMD